MKSWQKIFTFLGRISISLLFILSAINKIMDWQESEHTLNNLLLDWQSYSSFSEPLQNFFNTLLEWNSLLLVLMVVIQLVGGFLVFLGMKVRSGAFLLLFFLIPTTLLFHHFWFMTEPQKEIELILFFKNVAIGGGLFYVLAFGAEGPKSKSSSSGKGAKPSSSSDPSKK